MIAAVSLDNGGSDMGKMAPMVDTLAAAYGSRPGEHLADGGYASLADIAALTLAARPPTCRCPSPSTRTATVIGRAPTTARRSPPGASAWPARKRARSTRSGQRRQCANAQARNRGLRQFPVRGLAKVTAIALWFALAHNMMRILALTGGVDRVL